MKKPTNITRALLSAIRTDVDAVLADIAQRHGVVLRCGSGSFGEQTAYIKLEVAITSAPGELPAHVKAREDWQTYAARLGLDRGWLGATMSRAKGNATIIGLLPKRVKFPVLVRGEDGKEVLITVAEVASAMKAGAPKIAAAN